MLTVSLCLFRTLFNSIEESLEGSNWDFLDIVVCTEKRECCQHAAGTLVLVVVGFEQFMCSDSS